MPDVGLRWFVSLLREQGEFVESTRPVSLVHELAAQVDASERGENKAFLFHAVEGHGIPVAAGLYGSTRRHLLGLRMGDMEEFAKRLEQAIARPVPPERLGGRRMQRARKSGSLRAIRGWNSFRYPLISPVTVDHTSLRVS